MTCPSAGLYPRQAQSSHDVVEAASYLGLRSMPTPAGVPDRSLPVAADPRRRHSFGPCGTPRWRAGLSRGRPFIAARRPSLLPITNASAARGRGESGQGRNRRQETQKTRAGIPKAVTAPASSHVAKPTVPVQVRPHAGPASPARLAQKPAADRAYSVAVQPKSTNIWMNQIRRIRARCASERCGRCSCLACRRSPPPMARPARPSRRSCRAVTGDRARRDVRQSRPPALDLRIDDAMSAALPPILPGGALALEHPETPGAAVSSELDLRTNPTQLPASPDGARASRR